MVTKEVFYYGLAMYGSYLVLFANSSIKDIVLRRDYKHCFCILSDHCGSM